MDKTTKKHSIRARITTVIVAAVTISIVVVSSAGNFIANNLYETESKRLATSKLETGMEQLSAWIELKMNMTDFIAQEIVDRGYLDDHEKCRQFMIDCANKDSDIYDTYMNFEDSSYIFCSDWTPTIDEYDPLTRVWYQEAMKIDDVYVSTPYVDADSQRLVITCSRKVSSDGKAVGVLAQDIFIDDFSRIVENLKIDNNGYAIMATDDDTIIVHTGNSDYTMGIDGSGNEVEHSLSEAFEGYVRPGDAPVNLVDYSGEKVKYVEVDVPVTGWQLGYAMNWSEYYDEIIKVVMLFAFLTVVFAVLIGLIVFFLLKKTFKPLAMMAENSKEVAAGNLSVSFDYNDNDEIGDVCSAIEENNRVVKKYIDDIDSRLEALAHGDFSLCSSVEYIGDYNSIKISLDNISAALKKFIGGIDNVSTAVLSSSEQVSSGSQNLSHGATEQASSIQELSATIQTINKNVNVNADSSRQAMNKTNETGSEMRRAMDKMEELVKAMTETKECSDQIGKIIKSIEDIAFQTNILALNASVEAARAGAAGKGFAVVADEVRNLAAKSSEAAANTNTLIENTISSVDRGDALVTEVASVMALVAQASKEVSELNTNICDSSAQLAESISEINSGIEQISNVVQTNAATAQHSASASEQLTGQAHSLKGLVDEFVAK